MMTNAFAIASRPCKVTTNARYGFAFTVLHSALKMKTSLMIMMMNKSIKSLMNLKRASSIPVSRQEKKFRPSNLQTPHIKKYI